MSDRRTLMFTTAVAIVCVAACNTQAPRDEGSRLSADAPSRVSGVARAPVLIKRIEPSCPQRIDHQRAETTIEAIVEMDGRIRDVKVVKGSRDSFILAAEEALRRWEFQPGTLNGDPVPVFLTFYVQGCWLSPPIQPAPAGSTGPALMIEAVLPSATTPIVFSPSEAERLRDRAYHQGDIAAPVPLELPCRGVSATGDLVVVTTIISTEGRVVWAQIVALAGPYRPDLHTRVTSCLSRARFASATMRGERVPVYFNLSLRV